jgi:hypothetical protein
VAELLDRYDLSLTDIEIRAAPCERRAYETHRKKRIPLDDCITAIAEFCDCKVWREKNPAGEGSYVFFGLRSDVEAAHYLTELIDGAVRAELGRYKTSPDYRRFRHQDRHMANASFALGMVASIADKLMAIKAARDAVNNGTGRGLVVLKGSASDCGRSTGRAGWYRRPPTMPAAWPAHRWRSTPRSGASPKVLGDQFVFEARLVDQLDQRAEAAGRQSGEAVDGPVRAVVAHPRQVGARRRAAAELLIARTQAVDAFLEVGLDRFRRRPLLQRDGMQRV